MFFENLGPALIILGAIIGLVGIAAGVVLDRFL